MDSKTPPPPPVPKKPEVSHTKKVSTVSIRTIIGREGEKTHDLASRNKSESHRSNSESRNSGSIEVLRKQSNDSRDPLNWPRWKKEMSFCSLLLSTAVVSMLKTAFVSTNGVIALQLNCSYMAAAALTGAPFLFAALSSLGTSILSQVIGKRGIFIISGAIMLIGAMLNMHVDSYAVFMVVRLLQGLGWGAAEEMAVVSIRDIFMINERGIRIHIHTLTSLTFTWGSPILGGYLSQGSDGYGLMLMVITIIQAFSVFSLIFCLPETTFSRTSSDTNISSQNAGTTPTAMKSYLATLHRLPDRASFSLAKALKPIRAIAAPTTILTLLATFPVVPTTHALANSLSLLFGTAPTFVFPTRLGLIFILPFIFAISSYTALLLVGRYRSSRSSFPMSEVLPAMLIGILGLVGFGTYTVNQLGPIELTNGVTVFSDPTGDSLSLRVISALFGMLVAGATMLSYSSSRHLCTSYLSPPSVSDVPLETGHRFWESTFTGIFTIAVPVWIELGGGGNIGVRDVLVGLAVMQILLGSSAGALMVMQTEKIEKLDHKIMGDSQHPGVGGSDGLKKWDIRDGYGGA